MSTLTLQAPAAPGGLVTSAARPSRVGRDLDVELVQAVRRIAYRPTLWRNAVRFDAAERTYTRIPSTGLDIEAWLLTWLPGQHTSLHDHGGTRGAFFVVTGSLSEHSVEQDYDGRSSLRTRTLEAGDLRSFGPEHVHQVVNDGDEPAVSIHVYAPSLSSMREYRLDGFDLVRTGEEKRDVDW